MGWQDNDLIKRAEALGADVQIQPATSNDAVKNTKEDSIKYCAQEGMTWKNFNELNKKSSKLNVLQGKLRANGGLFCNAIKVEKYLGGRQDRLTPLATAFEGTQYCRQFETTNNGNQWTLD